MAKAALESINGDNMYGGHGSAWSVIYVDIDAHNRNRTIFDTILPRESASKVKQMVKTFMFIKKHTFISRFMIKISISTSSHL